MTWNIHFLLLLKVIKSKRGPLLFISSTLNNISETTVDSDNL